MLRHALDIYLLQPDNTWKLLKKPGQPRVYEKSFLLSLGKPGESQLAFEARTGITHHTIARYFGSFSTYQDLLHQDTLQESQADG